MQPMRTRSTTIGRFSRNRTTPAQYQAAMKLMECVVCALSLPHLSLSLSLSLFRALIDLCTRARIVMVALSAWLTVLNILLMPLARALHIQSSGK